MHSMKYEGIWQHILSAAAQHAGTRQPCPNVMPWATFLLSITPVWISLSWFIMKPSSLSASAKKSWSQHQSEPGMFFSQRSDCLHQEHTVQGGWLTLGSGFPVMVLSSSWRWGQFPWEYQPGLSSDGSPSLSSTSLTEWEERESDTTVWPNSNLLHDHKASSHPAPSLVSSTSPQHTPEGNKETEEQRQSKLCGLRLLPMILLIQRFLPRAPKRLSG